MTARILAACGPGEVRLAVLEEDRLVEVALDRPACPDGVGDLYLGRIEAVLPALGGAFVHLGGTPSGFLPDSEGAEGITEGTHLPVRVTRSAQGGKGPRLTARLEAGAPDYPSGQSGGLIARGPDALHRLAAIWDEAPIRCDDAALVARLRPGLGGRVERVARAFDDRLEAELDQLAEPDVALPGGLRASIHPTPALVAIDVDGAASSAARAPKHSAQFAANRAAIPALIHQLRLRNLSGAILVDLAGLAARKREALAPDIEGALARDPLRPRLLGFTALGLAEIVRPRIHPPLHELLSSPLGAGLAALRAVLRGMGPGGKPPALRCGIAVASALRADAAALSEFARRAAAPLALRMDPSLPAARWIIED